MNAALRLLPATKSEFDSAIDWYERQSPGLGGEFFEEVRIVMDRIRSNPHAHPDIHNGVRKAVVRRFPYVILYSEETHEVIVIAIFHAARDPSVWRART